jgi:hypothetical protein
VCIFGVVAAFNAERGAECGVLIARCPSPCPGGTGRGLGETRDARRQTEHRNHRVSPGACNNNENDLAIITRVSPGVCDNSLRWGPS